MLSPTENSRPRDGNLLLTGATGFVGAALLAETLTSTGANVACLVRAENPREARTRVMTALRPWLGVERAEQSLDRVHAVRADITTPCLGLTEHAWHALAEWTTDVVHCAATVRFDEPLDTARTVNVSGTRRVLDLAQAAWRAGSLERAVMVSTAFVAGTTPRVFAEDELDIGQAFRNTYERSKFEAEQLVQCAAAEIPVCVVRPSIVVGHSESGQTTAFNVLYAPMRILLRRCALATLPLRADVVVDTVPIDWVTRLVRAVLDIGENGVTYAAASGAGALTAGDVAAIACGVFDVDPPCLLPAGTSDRLVDQLGEAWRERLTPRESAALDVYAPYLARGARFDSRRAEDLMARAGHVAADPRLVMARCLEYARATNFGRLRANHGGRQLQVAAQSPSAVA